MSGVADIWARRKAAVQAEAEEEVRTSEAAAIAEEQQNFDAMSDAEVLDALNLPDPDTLTMGDDFKGFMAQAVPDRIRRRALRTLWRSNPVLANVDMLVDYGEDFTDSATVIEDLQTAYQVGKGMLKHVEAMAKRAEDEEAPETDAECDAIVDVTEEIEAVSASADLPVADTMLDLPHEDDVEDLPMTARPRRMVFQTEDVT